MIKEAAIACVATYGLENTTTKKVATSIGISEGTIFNYFSSKKQLLSECLYYVDAQIDAALKTVPFHGLNISKAVRDLWFSYFHYMLDNSTYAKFYLRYRQSSYYDEEVMLGQHQSFSFFGAFAKKNVHFFRFQHDFYWLYIIETTLTFAVRVSDGVIPGEPEDIEHIYKLIAHGFIGNLKPGRRH